MTYFIDVKKALKEYNEIIRVGTVATVPEYILRARDWFSMMDENGFEYVDKKRFIQYLMRCYDIVRKQYMELIRCADDVDDIIISYYYNEQGEYLRYISYLHGATADNCNLITKKILVDN